MRLLSTKIIPLLAVAATIGCGGRDVPLVSIDGKITFDGAPPPKPGKIIFSPSDSANSGLLARPGNADFDAAGSFTVTTFSAADGLIPGKYHARVLCFRETPTLENQQTVSLVPANYSAEITIPADVGSFEVRLDVPPMRTSKTGP
jgi:hypothetical protein